MDREELQNTLQQATRDTQALTQRVNNVVQARRSQEPGTVEADALTKPQTPLTVSEPEEPQSSQQFVESLDPAIEQANQGLVDVQTKEARQRDALLEQIQNRGPQNTQDTFKNAFQSEVESITGKPSDEFMQQLSDANTRLAQLRGRFRQNEADIQTSEGQSQVFARAQSAENERQRAVAVGNQALMVQALQGNYDTARQIALDTAEFAAQDRKAQLNNLITQYDAVSGVVRGQQKQLIEKARRRAETERAELERTQTAIDSAITSGAASVGEMQQLTSRSVSNGQKQALAQQIVARASGEQRALERQAQQANIAQSRASTANSYDAIRSRSVRDDIAREKLNISTRELQAELGNDQSSQKTIQEIRDLSSGDKETIANARSTIDQLERMKQLVRNTNDAQLLSQTNESGREFQQLATNVVDKLARERTGAVVGENEEKQFKKIVGIGFFNQILKDDNELIKGLDRLEGIHKDALKLSDPSGNIGTFLDSQELSDDDAQEIDTIYGGSTSNLINPSSYY